MSSANRKPKSQALAFFVSDLHFCHTAPLSRAEKGAEWYDVMDRHFKMLTEATTMPDGRRIPIVIAGDIFDKWNSPPELTNFLIRRFASLPTCYAIPGQHDLPFHSYADIKRSAYWTLVESNVINHIPAAQTGKYEKMVTELNTGHGERVYVRVWGFPWGDDIQPMKRKSNHKTINVALVHKYVWCKGHAYPNAPKENYIEPLINKLDGYDASFFGDNHSGFFYQSPERRFSLMNCGAFIRRKADEINYKPMGGILHEDRTVTPYYFPQDARDRFLVAQEMQRPEEVDVRSFLKALKGMDSESLDFAETLSKYARRHREKLSADCFELIIEILEAIRK